MYLPLAAAGFALITLPMTVLALSTSLSSRERDLAHRNVNQCGLVRAELDLTGLHFLTGLGDSIVTVPVFGFGISPRGPSTLPNFRPNASCRASR